MLGNPIYTITPFSLLDYPEKSACILWYVGCNMRCLYCYNPEIVLGKGTMTFAEIISFLHKRRGLLDAVVFSGGECLIHKNIYDQIKIVKSLGFLVKIDTNGSNPDVLVSLIQEKRIDYVALDFKAIENKFSDITKSNLFKQFERSLTMLIENKIKFEIRTTYHSKLISIDELNEMISFLKEKHYIGNYYIQNFRNASKTISKLQYSMPLTKEKIANNATINVVIR